MRYWIKDIELWGGGRGEPVELSWKARAGDQQQTGPMCCRVLALFLFAAGVLLVGGCALSDFLSEEQIVAIEQRLDEAEANGEALSTQIGDVEVRFERQDGQWVAVGAYGAATVPLLVLWRLRRKYFTKGV
jgi:hypothetical protein